MKIFNNFDTELRKNEFKEAIRYWGKENVILVKRYKSYLILKGIIPGIFVFVSYAISIYLLTKFLHYGDVLYWVILAIFSVPVLYFIRRFILIFIDYKLDFAIVTKDEIITHKQLGFFKSKFKQLPMKKIRSITSWRDWILGNIFSFGYIEFISDGSTKNTDGYFHHAAWTVRFSSVYEPNITRKNIVNLSKNTFLKS